MKKIIIISILLFCTLHPIIDVCAQTSQHKQLVTISSNMLNFHVRDLQKFFIIDEPNLKQSPVKISYLIFGEDIHGVVIQYDKIADIQLIKDWIAIRLPKEFSKPKFEGIDTYAWRIESKKLFGIMLVSDECSTSIILECNN